MRPNKLRELLKAGKPTLGTHIHSTWPSEVEAIGHTGLYDYVEFVAEYGPFTLHDLDNLARAAELYNMGSMIKVDQEPRTFLSQRAVGSGFTSVLFADCRTVQEAEDIAHTVYDLGEWNGHSSACELDGGTFTTAVTDLEIDSYGPLAALSRSSSRRDSRRDFMALRRALP